MATLVQQEGSGSAHIDQSSVDFVFIDPAYVDKVQYGELNFVWESWLGFDGSWLKDEIVVNPFRDKTIDDWDRDMRAVLAKLYLALKPGRWMSLCYHDTDPSTWTRLQNMLLDTGFGDPHRHGPRPQAEEQQPTDSREGCQERPGSQLPQAPAWRCGTRW